MAVPSSGQLREYADIGVELGVAQTNVSLRGMSQTAGFSTPDAMSEFYGYSSAPIGAEPNPSSLTLQTSTQIAGGTYRFSGFVLDKVNGGKFYYIRNGGFNYNRIALATMSGFDVSTAVLNSTSTNFGIGYYAKDIAGDPSGTTLSSTGYENNNSNQYITTYGIPSAWTVPTSFSNSTSRPYPASNGIDFNLDGTKIYHTNTQAGIRPTMYEQSLSTPFNPATVTSTTTINLNNISTEDFPLPVTWPTPQPTGWYPQQFRWNYSGTTLYYGLLYQTNNTAQTYRLKAYNASVPFDITTLSERAISTSLDMPQFYNPQGNVGFSISQDGHFLFGIQPANYGNQFLYMFA